MSTVVLSQCSRRPILSIWSSSSGIIGRRSMSVRPPSEESKVGQKPARKKVTIEKLHQMKIARTPITMLTAYDYPTGRACEAYNVDITLVGDSLAQVCLGYASTTSLTLDAMVHHAAAVARGSHSPFLVADLPFGAVMTSPDDAVRAAIRLVREGGVEAVKIEGGKEIVQTVRRLTKFGVPVMAHVGLLPQRHSALSGYKVQGKTARSARGISEAAQELQDAGAFAVVLEAIPHKLGAYITEKLRIPTIGIGAGPGCDGQVLVWDDVMGTWDGHQAKFARRFADVKGEAEKGVKAYVAAVRTGAFPDPEKEGYAMAEGEWEAFLQQDKLNPTLSPLDL